MKTGSRPRAGLFEFFLFSCNHPKFVLGIKYLISKSPNHPFSMRSVTFNPCSLFVYANRPLAPLRVSVFIFCLTRFTFVYTRLGVQVHAPPSVESMFSHVFGTLGTLWAAIQGSVSLLRTPNLRWICFRNLVGCDPGRVSLCGRPNLCWVCFSTLWAAIQVECLSADDPICVVSALGTLWAAIQG